MLDLAGKSYKTVTIGTQIWMAENLAWLPSVNAATDYSNTAVKYYVYDYDGTSVAAAKAASNYTTYGVLYNFQAAVSACPYGWHLPDTTDWNKLEEYVDTNNGAKGVGNSLKSTTGWKAFSGIVNSDDFGFKALPGGFYKGGSFYNVGINAYFWTSAANGTTSAWSRNLNWNFATVYRSSNYHDLGFSVRCLKDAN